MAADRGGAGPAGSASRAATREAESLLTAALAIHRAEMGPPDPVVASDLQGLGLVAAYTRAATRNRRHITARPRPSTNRIPRCRAPPTATCLNDYALMLLETGHGDEAEPMFRKALDIQRRELGEDHPEVANTLFNLALLCSERGDFKAAEPIQRQVLALDRQHYDANHPNVAYSLMSTGRHAGRKRAVRRGGAGLFRGAGDSRGPRWSRATRPHQEPGHGGLDA